MAGQQFLSYRGLEKRTSLWLRKPLLILSRVEQKRRILMVLKICNFADTKSVEAL
jgi:hypothetical protein